MIIQYINPLSRALERMKTVLFKPFNLGKWFALGFTAFLAGLMNSTGGGFGGGNYNAKSGDFDWGAFYQLPARIMGWISENPFWMMVISAGIIVGIILAVVLTWLSSRGMFMFLDNVVHNRSLIEKPWREFKAHGDSLFLWRIVFMAISVILFLGLIVAAFLAAYRIYLGGNNIVSHIMLILGIAFIGLLLFLILFFIWIFLNDFVVPIMYRTGLRVNDAWRKFMALFGMYPGHFILYGFFIMGLYILVGIGVVIIGLMTCCCGFILLAIPYIGSVLILPISVTFRSLSLEYLEQFGDEYRIFPAGSDNACIPAAENVTPVV